MARYFLRNPGFELGDTAWTKGTGWSIADDPTNARSGAWVGVKAANGVDTSLTYSVFASIRPGGKLSISGWLKHSGTYNSNSDITIRWLDDDDLTITSAPSSSQLPAGTTSYTNLRAVDQIAPARTKSATIAVRSGSASVGSLYADDLEISGDIIETIPANATLSDYRIIPARTTARFDPLVGGAKFSDFNSGMSDRWAGVYTFTPQARGADLNDLLAMLNRIGKTDRFFAYDPDRATPLGGTVSGLAVNGAVAQGATVIPIDGGTASTTPLVAGDYVEIGSQYFQLQRDCELGPEATGELVVWPAVRTALADNEDVITDHPKMVARVTSDIEWTRRAGDLTSVSISFLEA